ncbi:hypothetical protein TWF225_010683 [Orbilia oligospora]|nr:hypothetical protein TWF225_010683 [Orbilia oligospora]KAF3240640.1 hypothetical protein TWF128_011255 [Orbilia oligospora]KAF3243659.1 hypothetical protein TWF217_011168 [Orbilia oligospora]KAF3281840.1 hypothetical protein TWF132_011062 [Orbilia oligospora]
MAVTYCPLATIMKAILLLFSRYSGEFMWPKFSRISIPYTYRPQYKGVLTRSTCLITSRPLNNQLRTLTDISGTDESLRQEHAGMAKSLFHGANGSRNSGSSDFHPSGRAKEPPKTWYLFEEYHDKIREKVQGVIFSSNIQESDGEGERNLTGSFRCSNSSCEHVWFSGKIAAIIRKYNQRDSQLDYNVQVYNQRCKSCKSLGIMKLDEDAYVERVARLLKIWKGEDVPEVSHDFRQTDPHEDELWI